MAILTGNVLTNMPMMFSKLALRIYSCILQMKASEAEIKWHDLHQTHLPMKALPSVFSLDSTSV